MQLRPPPPAAAPSTPVAGAPEREGETDGEDADEPGEIATEADDELSDLHADFLGLHREEGPPAAPQAAPQDQGDAPAAEKAKEETCVAKIPLQDVLLKGAGYRFEYLIALVPDPLDSTLANNFDFALDALRRAFARHDYLPDRAYLPWLGSEAKENRYRRQPGILLFRRADGTDRRLASVLLVGERPKTGIHAAAFRAAVEMLSRRGAGKLPEPPLRILGPSFSGSAESLRLALLNHSDLDFKIVTGTATADGLESIFAGALAPDTVGSVSFCRTVLPDSVLQREAWKFFEETLGWNPGRIALLVEEDTGYGGGAASPGGNERNQDKPLLVRFPTGLTGVRKLWETNRPRRDATPVPTLPGVAAPQDPISELSLADPSTPAEVAAEFDPVTPRTKELMIANLLESIPRQGARYVGIVATDTRDKLYLTERVRGFASGAVLFAFENHLVQAHPRFVRPLRPVLLVGNFPTTIDERAETKTQPAFVQQFGSEFHQGVFRAAELLVARVSGAPTAEGRAERDEPRVWITVSAKGTILPVASIVPASPRARICPAPEPSRLERHPWWQTGRALVGWLLTRDRPSCDSPPSALGRFCDPPSDLPSLGATGYLLLGLGAALLLVLALLLQAAVPPGATGTANLLVAFGTAALWLPGTALFLLAFPRDFLAEPWLQGNPWLVGALWWSAAIPFVGLTTLFIVAAVPVAQSGVRDLDEAENLAAAGQRGKALGRAATGFGKAAIPLVPTLLLLAFAAWVLATRGDGTEYLRYLHLRARHPLSGVSPLPPLVCLGLAAWVWSRLEMQRLRLRTRFEVGWPHYRSSEPALVGCQELASKVDERTAELLPTSPRFWMMLMLALLPAGTLLRAIQPITEPRAYGWVFFGLCFFPFLLATVSFLRFVRLWRRLERLLDRLEQSNFCSALDEIGVEVDWKPISSFNWRIPSFRLLVLAARKLKVVEERTTTEVTGEGTIALDALLAQFFAAEQEGNLPRELEARRRLRKAFAAAAARLDAETGGCNVTAFLAVQLVSYLRYVFLHLRQSLAAAIATWLFLLLGVSFYAFEPKRLMSMFLWLALGVGSILALWAFVQMDRNSILCRVGKGRAGRVDFTRPFVVNAVTYGLAPLAAVVLSIFPELGSHFGRWADPLLRLLGN